MIFLVLLSTLIREHPIKAQVLKRAAGFRCEHCSHVFPSQHLAIHFLYPDVECGSDNPDPENDILVVCMECSRSFFSIDVEKEMLWELVRCRDNAVKSAIHQTLCAPILTYTPPGECDPEVMYREMIGSGALDLCLNGG